MPTLKTTRSRKVSAGAGNGRSRSLANARYRARTATRSASTGKSDRKNNGESGSVLTGWGTYGTSGKRLSNRVRQVSRLDAISTLRFAMLIIVIATAFTLYVGHVQDMQNLLADLQRAQRENLRLNLKYNRMKGAFDRETGPAIIYERARGLGLEEGIEYGPTIIVE